MELFVNDREFSDLEILQHSGKGKTAGCDLVIQIACKPITTMDGVSSVVTTKERAYVL
jgi:hypothetical protein